MNLPEVASADITVLLYRLCISARSFEQLQVFLREKNAQLFFYNERNAHIIDGNSITSIQAIT